MTFIAELNRMRLVAQQNNISPARIVFNEKQRKAVEEELGSSESYLGVKIVFVNDQGEEV